MYNRRFTCCIIALVAIFVSAVGYRIYTDQVEFKRNSVDAFVDQDSIDKDTSFLAGRGEVTMPAESTALGATIGKTEKNGFTLQSPVKVRYAPVGGLPIKEEDIELVSVETFSVDELVPQFVETPDGKKHKVLRPPGEKYKIRPGTFMGPSELEYARVKVTIDGVTYNVPEGESTDSYIDKIHLSSMYDVSIEEVERMIKKGLIPSSPIEVGASLFGDEPLPIGAPMPFPHRAGATVSESAAVDGLDDFDVPSDSVDKVPPVDGTRIHPEGGHVHELPTAESQETQPGEGVSPERFNKAQQLIDQYGTEEGLRRFREMDPEAARQFEQERRPTPAREVPSEVESSTQ